MHRFFLEKFAAGECLSLAPEESLHLTKVLRMEAGESLEVFDGRGSLGAAILKKPHAKSAQVEIQTVSRAARHHHLEIAFGYCKPPAMEFVLRRATEVGVQSFQPLYTQNSMHPDHWNGKRWERILMEVTKQCQSNFLPELKEPLPFKTWIAQNTIPLVVCDEAKRDSKLSNLQPKTAYALVVGPEGGWSAEERASLHTKAHALFGLGENRLRVEMACLVGLVLLKQNVHEIQ